MENYIISDLSKNRFDKNSETLQIINKRLNKKNNSQDVRAYSILELSCINSQLKEILIKHGYCFPLVFSLLCKPSWVPQATQHEYEKLHNKKVSDNCTRQKIKKTA